jgi:hypothetical protein
MKGIAASLIAAHIALAQAERSPDDWLALTVEIQRSIEQADFEDRPLKNIEADDRRFVRKMLNELSASPEAKPTPAQGQWLLSIKRWLEEK